MHDAIVSSTDADKIDLEIIFHCFQMSSCDVANLQCIVLSRTLLAPVERLQQEHSLQYQVTIRMELRLTMQRTCPG